MTVLIRQLFGLVLLLAAGLEAQAAEVWYYELRDPQTLGQAAVNAGPAGPAAAAPSAHDRHWVLTEFETDPFPGQLGLLKQAAGFEKLSLLFHRSPAPALADDYADVAAGLTRRGIELELKFSGTLPTEDEARIVRRACDAGARVTYVSNSFPTPYEAANLKSLGACVELVLVLGHYPKYDEIKDFRVLEGLKLSLVNDYFPQYAHMDVLNILGLPVSLHVSDGVPGLADLTYLNAIKPLTGFSWEMKAVPADGAVYSLLSKLDRKGGARRFSLRWVYSLPRDLDVEAWAGLKPDRLQLNLEGFRKHEDRLRRLPGQILVETFPIDGYR